MTLLSWDAFSRPSGVIPSDTFGVVQRLHLKQTLVFWQVEAGQKKKVQHTCLKTISHISSSCSSPTGSLRPIVSKKTRKAGVNSAQSMTWRRHLLCLDIFRIILCDCAFYFLCMLDHSHSLAFLSLISIFWRHSLRYHRYPLVTCNSLKWGG